MQTLDEQEMKNLNSGLLVIRLIWLGLFIALIVYIVIANILGEGMILEEGESDPVFDAIGYILVVFGLIQIGVSYFLKKAVLNQKGALSKIMGYMSMADPSTLVISGGNPNSAVGRYIGGMLFIWGLCECIGIYALVMFILNGDFLYFYIMIGISVASLIYFRPRKQELVDIALQLKEDESAGKKVKCSRCSQYAFANHKFCPYCGEPMH